MNNELETKSISAIEENYSMIDSDYGIRNFLPEQVRELEKWFKIREKYNRRIVTAGKEINKLQLKNIIDQTKQRLLDTLLS
jgi:hypothetical protein